jgi:hypothetical protein
MICWYIVSSWTVDAGLLQVCKLYPKTTANFASQLMTLLDTHCMLLEPALRRNLVQVDDIYCYTLPFPKCDIELWGTHSSPTILSYSMSMITVATNGMYVACNEMHVHTHIVLESHSHCMTVCTGIPAIDKDMPQHTDPLYSHATDNVLRQTWKYSTFVNTVCRLSSFYETEINWQLRNCFRCSSSFSSARTSSWDSCCSNTSSQVCDTAGFKPGFTVSSLLIIQVGSRETEYSSHREIGVETWWGYCNLLILPHDYCLVMQHQ